MKIKIELELTHRELVLAVEHHLGNTTTDAIKFLTKKNFDMALQESIIDHLPTLQEFGKGSHRKELLKNIKRSYK